MFVAALPVLTLLACGRVADAPPPPPRARPAPPPRPPSDGILRLGEVEVLRDLDPVRVERQPWTLDDEHGVAVRVRLPRSARLQVAAADTVRPFDVLLPSDPGPWVAVNGGFYDEHGAPMGLVVADGRTVHRLGRSGSGVLEQGPVALRIVHRDAWKPGADAAVQSIDRLVEDGHPLVNPSDAARRAARSGVALSADAAWVVVAFADDSVTETPEGVALHATSLRGLPLWAFARYLVDAVHAEQALNLDGAISTQLVVQGGDWRWSVEGEAGTVQAVVLRP